MDVSQHTVPNDAPVKYLACADAFKTLSEAERLYAYRLGRASWYGGLICLHQTSAESPGIFLLLQNIFRAQTPEELRAAACADGGIDDEKFDAFLMFAAQFYGNVGNYQSFGDTKILPRLSLEEFEQIVSASAAYASSQLVRDTWQKVKPHVCSLSPGNRQLGLGSDGVSAYFSANCDLEDAKFAQAFLDAKGISAYNTRLFKSEASDGQTLYTVMQAAEMAGEVAKEETFEHDGRSALFRVERGDYRELLHLLLDELQQAKEAALNPTQAKMLEEYARSFREGSVDAHKDGSRHWIRDKSPAVENYIGFIESYRDPYGVRGEFESFVAVVNKEQSRKFSALVAGAEAFLPLLPWPKEYEKDKFLQPDFTALEIVTYASSGVPLGINIPNYDAIRQEEGFKNVSLGNVLTSRFSDPKTSFLADADRQLWLKYIAESFEVQVGLHELLGHGSGKLLQQLGDGSFNFDREAVRSLLTGGSVASWYGPGDTWDSRFSTIASAYEECRAECVGVYLCTVPQVLAVFGHSGQEAGDVAYINWLCMARAGVASLEMYSPENCSWRQAHSRARFAILRVLLEAGQGLVSIDEVAGDDGEPDLVVRLDRTKVETVARPAVGEFLQKLQFYKATGDVDGGRPFFEACSRVEQLHLRLRSVVMDRRKPRPVFVQANMLLAGGGQVELAEFGDGPAEMIRSFQERFPACRGVEQAVLRQWQRDLPLLA